nr:MAG TPA_asm: hypothetical protein [Caudoviricetes sp.]
MRSSTYLYPPCINAFHLRLIIPDFTAYRKNLICSLHILFLKIWVTHQYQDFLRHHRPSDVLRPAD